MKIVAEHLVRLPMEEGKPGSLIYKVLETSSLNKQFYREAWYGGHVRYELVDPELFYEQNSKTDLSV